MTQAVTAAELSQLIQDFSRRRVLLVGDLVADHYITGKSSRLSREAPVIILKFQGESVIPGQAGNTAANIAALGGEARLVGVIGTDMRGDQLFDALTAANVQLDGTVRSSTGSTLTKTRILAGGHHTAMQQVIRIDDDERLPASQTDQDQVLANMRSTAEWADAIIVSDYGYGVVTEETWKLAREIADQRKIPLVLDSRYSLTRWTGATLITPNEEEALAAAAGGGPASDIKAVGSRLCEVTQCKNLIITRGNEGMVLFGADTEPVHLPAFGSKECTDVTGAGDTVVATATLALASGANALKAMILSNLAGSLVVMKLGTATTTQDEMKAEIHVTGAVAE